MFDGHHLTAKTHLANLYCFKNLPCLPFWVIIYLNLWVNGQLKTERKKTRQSLFPLTIFDLNVMFSSCITSSRETTTFDVILSLLQYARGPHHFSLQVQKQKIVFTFLWQCHFPLTLYESFFFAKITINIA